ncbi:hypothetical protein CYMTET_46449, partial [Cymbomonas tetramitiformis]
VYTEFILKKNNDCLDWQQMQLYGFGVFFNIVTLTIADLRAGFNKGAWAIVLLDGYNWATYMCVVNLSFAGMLTSWVLKFADTVTKVIATSMAMLLSSAISIIYFKEQPSLQLFLGIGISTLAVRLYYFELPKPGDEKPCAEAVVPPNTIPFQHGDGKQGA